MGDPRSVIMAMIPAGTALGADHPAAESWSEGTAGGDFGRRCKVDGKVGVHYVGPMDMRRSYYRSPAGRSRGRRRTRGQSLVEFALVVPIFLLLLCGILDFGVVLYSRMTVINAAREGARVATLMAGESVGDITSKARDTANNAAGGLDVSTSVSCENSCKAGAFVTVTVSHDHRVFFPLLFGTSIPMSSTVKMVMEETGTGT